VAADEAQNYCGGSAVVLRIGRSTAANDSHFCEKQLCAIRKITACKTESECFGAFFSAKTRFAITAITLLSLYLAQQLSVSQSFTCLVIAVIAKIRKNSYDCARVKHGIKLLPSVFAFSNA